jgi:hypothetical protein
MTSSSHASKKKKVGSVSTTELKSHADEVTRRVTLIDGKKEPDQR